MDAVMNIQIKVAAREAQQTLKRISQNLATLETAVTGKSSQTIFATMDSDARRLKMRIDQVNAGLQAMKLNNVRSMQGVLRQPGPGQASQWSPAIAIRERDKATKLAAQQALAAEKAQQRMMKQVWQQQVREGKLAKGETIALERAQQRMMKQVWQQQVRDARIAKTERVALEKAQQRMMRSVWNQQVIDAKSAAAQQVAAEKARNARLRAAWRQQVRDGRIAQSVAAQAEKTQSKIMKQIWAQQVRDGRAAKAQELADIKARDRMMKQVWQQQVRDAKAKAVQLNQIERERIAAEKALYRQEQAAERQRAAQEAANAAARGKTAKTAARLNVFERMALAVDGPSALHSRGILAFGKDLQWVGRQLNFNFTIPLLVAGGAAMKWALDVERAFTRVKKVYGDGTKDYTAELEKVRIAMRLLSDQFGVAQEEVMQLAGLWAAAGATGGELARSVETTLELVILGDYEDTEEAFRDLITIQGAYQLSATETAAAITLLNTTENMTAATMQDLTKGIALAGGTANVAGVSIATLAAHVAALVPVTGTAATAGNALKTIYSQIMKPTGEMVDVLRAIGIEFSSQEFQALNVADRLQFVADKYGTLTQSQKGYVASILAGRRQLNRFLVLAEALADRESVYHRVMKALDPGNAEANWKNANKEIQTLLRSDPKKLEIVTTQIKNLLIDAVIPLIPFVINLVTEVRNVIEWFSNLDPWVHKLTITLGGLAIATGIASQLFGSLVLLFGSTVRPLIWLGRQIFAVAGLFKLLGVAAIGAFGAVARGAWAAGAAVVGMFTRAAVASVGAAAAAVSPWLLVAGAIVAAVSVVVYLIAQSGTAITDIFGKVWSFIKDAFSKLPEWAASALGAVVGFFAKAFGAIGDWWSKIWNGPQKKPIWDKFDYEVKDAQRQATQITKQVIEDPVVQEQTQSADALADTSVQKQIDNVQAQLESMKPAIEAQEQVVKAAEAAYDAAAAAADRFDASLRPLREEVERLSVAINAANEKIDVLANTPITGMTAMSDAIFENEMAQKRLRLEMLRLAEAGESFEDVETRIAAINGDIENLRGIMTDLRLAGAGSDILNVYQKELDALELQRDGLEAQDDIVSQLQKQLEELERQGEILDLENSLAFDPLTRQIDKLVNGVEELSFDEIIAGIKEQKRLLAELTPAYEEARLELEAQELILESLQAQRDALRDTYDIEQAKLDELNEAYREVEETLIDLENQMRDTQLAIEDLTGDWETPSIQTFLDDTNLDLDTMIAEWENQINTMWDDVDLFEPIREQWSKFTGWWDRNIGSWFTRAGSWIDRTWDSLFDGKGFDLSGIGSSLSSAWATAQQELGPIFDSIGKWLGDVWAEVSPYFDDIGDGFSDFFGEIGEGIASVLEEAGPIFESIMTVVGPLIAVIAPLMKEWFGFVASILGPMLEGLGKIIGGVLKMFAGVMGLIAGILTLDGEQIKESMGKWREGLLQIIDGIWTWVSGLVESYLKLWMDIGRFIIGGIASGLWVGAQGVWDFFWNLPGNIFRTVFGIYGMMWTFGSELLGNVVRGLQGSLPGFIDFFAKLPGRIAGAVSGVGGALWQAGGKLIGGLWDGIKWAWNHVASWWNGSIGSWGITIPDIPGLPGRGTHIGVPDFPTAPDNFFIWKHSGGVVPGSGDVPTMLMGGEMVLTGAQQARLFDIANGRIAGDRDSGGRTINFYGDLSFPNITSPDDAGRFIDNLELIS